ncbi:hypothetical protein CJU90_1095 [Yarrowia sp. C11]|nr:hypothetical protein CKK34_2508 [Yarrowia sp. E02]KAG5373397.1 hypothetical protein CJU90_1095 [Yarrowia sp. C11]
MDLRLVPTSRARVKRLISRDPSPLQLQQKRRDESSFAVQEMLSQRPPTDVRAILNTTVDALRKPESVGKSRDQSNSTLFVEIPTALLTKLQISTQFLLVKIDDGDFWMERFGGDIWGIFERRERVEEKEGKSRDEVVKSRDIPSDSGSQVMTSSTQDTQEDVVVPPRKDVSPHKLLGRSHVTEPSRAPQSRDDLLSRAPVVSSTTKTSSDSFTSLIASLPPPQSTATAYIPLNLTKPVSALPLPSVSVSELLLSSYRSQLYCCKTSLIYFAKAMSKSRALCKSTLEKHTQGKSRVFSASQMRKMSYKLYSRELAKLVQPLSEWSQVYEYSEFCKMLTNTKDEHVVQWKDNLPYSILSDSEKLAVEISLLKFREMQLQSIVLLELLAVAPVTKSSDPAEAAKLAEQEKQKKKEARKMGLYKSRRKVVETESVEESSTDYKTLLTQLFSSMCIWQQLSDSSTDHVQEFCKSVVIPYFSSRVPEVVQDLLKRAGLEREAKQTVGKLLQGRTEETKVTGLAGVSRDSPNLSRDSTPTPSLALSRDSDTLHSDLSTSSGVSRVSNRASRTGSQGVTGLLGKSQVRGGLLTSSRSFDSRTQVGMRFKGTKDKDEDREKEREKEKERSHVTVASVETGGMFRKSREVSTSRVTTVQSQVDATPLKRTRPVLTSFTAEPDNPFINDSNVVDDSPFAKRMRGESTGPRRRLGLSDGTSVVFDSARRREGGNRGNGSTPGQGYVDDSPVQRSTSKFSVMESPTRTRTVADNSSGGLFSNRPGKLFTTTIRPSMAAPVAAPISVSATPKRRTQPTLTNEQYPREDNPFYNGTDDVAMDTSPTKRR